MFLGLFHFLVNELSLKCQLGFPTLICHNRSLNFDLFAILFIPVTKIDISTPTYHNRGCKSHC